MQGLLSEALRLYALVWTDRDKQTHLRSFDFFVFLPFLFPSLSFSFTQISPVSPSPLSPSHRFLLFSDGWWCIAGVSQAESLLQTEPNLTFTAAACQAHQNLFSRMNPS